METFLRDNIVTLLLMWRIQKRYVQSLNFVTYNNVTTNSDHRLNQALNWCQNTNGLGREGRHVDVLANQAALLSRQPKFSRDRITAAIFMEVLNLLLVADTDNHTSDNLQDKFNNA